MASVALFNNEMRKSIKLGERPTLINKCLISEIRHLGLWYIKLRHALAWIPMNHGYHCYCGVLKQCPFHMPRVYTSIFSVAEQK